MERAVTECKFYFQGVKCYMLFLLWNKNNITGKQFFWKESKDLKIKKYLLVAHINTCKKAGRLTECVSDKCVSECSDAGLPDQKLSLHSDALRHKDTKMTKKSDFM